MSKLCYKRYSVYRRDNEMPLIIFATAKECAEAMGCDVRTFYSYLSRFSKGMPYPKNYLIYEDEIDEDEKEELRNPPKLSDIDCKIILALAPGDVNEVAVAEKMNRHRVNIYYHIKKIQQITGLNPRDETELKKLVQIAIERKQENGK